jgi:hypothetical protein
MRQFVNAKVAGLRLHPLTKLPGTTHARNPFGPGLYPTWYELLGIFLPSTQELEAILESPINFDESTLEMRCYLRRFKTSMRQNSGNFPTQIANNTLDPSVLSRAKRVRNVDCKAW